MSVRARLTRLAMAARARAGEARVAVSELVKIARVLTAPKHVRVVGYTKAHPIYTDVFEAHPPAGHLFYRRAKTRWFRALDARAWARIDLLHRDAATPPDPTVTVPTVVECEGLPAEEMLTDQAIRHVFVESRWAGGPYLGQHRVSLLRPSVELPPVRHDRRARRGGAVTLLAVGHGGMVKGIDLLARIYDALKDRAPIRLVIAGSLGHNFEYYPEVTREAYAAADFAGLERRLRADPRVILRPFRRSELLRRVYPAADIYIHLSRLETFGYSILEAMSHGLPVVATRLHAIPEMVRDGETGFLIDVDGLDINGAEWRERVFHEALHAVEHLVADPALRQRLGDAGRERIKRAFDITYKQRELVRVYDGILGEPPDAPAGRAAALSSAAD